MHISDIIHFFRSKDQYTSRKKQSPQQFIRHLPIETSILGTYFPIERTLQISKLTSCSPSNIQPSNYLTQLNLMIDSLIDSIILLCIQSIINNTRMEIIPIIETQAQPQPPNEQFQSQAEQAQAKVVSPPKVLTCIERATNLVDHITDSLYAQILNGFQVMNKRRRVKQLSEQNSPQHKRSMIQQRTIDIDLHKRMIRKFKRQNRKSIKSIEQRSIQFEESTKKHKQSQSMRRNEQKNKTLESRREKIAERLKSKERLKQQIQMMVKESNQKLGVVKSTKFLYQQKEETFKREVILPKIQEEKRLLAKRKERSKPMDLTQIFEHQKQYEEKLINDKLNRSLTSRVIQNENYYQPPKFVAKAFLIAEAEEEIKRQEQRLKEQSLQINDYRKKEFIKIMEQKQKQQLEKIKQISFQKSRNNRTFSVEGDQPKKQKPKIEPNREETKKIGNQYMKQLISLNRMHKSKPVITQMNSQASIKSQVVLPKSQFEIELIKQQRIEKVQRIRLKKIEDILNSNRIDSHFKLEQLNLQNDKFNQLILRKQDILTKNSEADELASLVLSSIHTKLAILEVSSPKS